MTARACFGVGVLVAGWVFCLSPASWAQPAGDPAPPEADLATRSGSPSAMELNEEGARYFEEGRYRLAVERFVHAYALESDSNLLFNIASCYERLGDTRAAVEKYQEFLRAPDAAPEGRAPAEAAIGRLQAQAEVAASDVAKGRPPRETERPKLLVIEDTLSAGAGSEGLLRWATLGSGVAVSSLGLVFYWMGSRDHARVTDAPGHADPGTVSSLSRADAEKLVDSGNSKKAVGVSGLALGGSLLAAYGLWTLWELYDDAPEASATSLAVMPRSGGGALGISGRF